MTEPKIGDIIYVPSSLYLGHGRDDFIGGKAKVTDVYTAISGGKPTIFVHIKERPGTGYNWENLEKKQKSLEERFGDKWSHPDPDLRPEFNDWW